MAYIDLKSELPGMAALLKYRPDTAKTLKQLAESLLRSLDSPLSPAERESIAAYVSELNGCKFCSLSHGATAKKLWQDKSYIVDAIKEDLDSADIDDKFKALLKIAGKVQEGGDRVSESDIEKAKELGASDREIHDTVLIASAACMFGRYLDGLGVETPEDPAFYESMADRAIAVGYMGVIPEPQN